MRIPEIQTRMREISVELSSLAEELSRRTSVRSVTTSRKLTDEMREEIIRLRSQNPTLSQHKIAARLNINPGRVSEVLAGYRS